MKAIVYTQHGLPIDNPESLVDIDLPEPVPGPRDLLVRVHAVSVNPVDTKIRRGAAVTAPRVVGWDAAGIVEAVGSAVTAFKPGDEVYYAGSLTRPGSYSELHLVDERIAGHKPATLAFEDAAALPLTSLTAWELLFDRLKVPEQELTQQDMAEDGRTLLVIGASGGVGSILTQLASKLTGLTVIGTASRPETAEWVRELGAHHVIDHSKPMKAQLQALGFEYADIVISLTHTDQHYADIVDILAPQGQFALIDDPDTLDAMPLKRKSISLHWELMFTRSMYETADMARQREILDRVAALVDAGVLKTTVGERIGKIDAANLRRAHAIVESNKARGKLVLAGF
ncbi:MAG TPA: zinc-binding alcohol dehydrogenase family protein [Pseudoduganella sp.]|jgi:zinc-binding alcohol dehydrogenase family protein